MNPIQILIQQIEAQHLWEKQESYARNAYLKVQGSLDTNIYYILSGSVRLFVLDGMEEHTIRFGYQNDFVAALGSYISEKSSDLYIQALRQTEVKVISKVSFTQLMKSREDTLEFWHSMLEQIILQQLERERDLLTASPLERYQRVLGRSPQLFQEIPHKYIASYLRMTPETLSRIKKS